MTPADILHFWFEEAGPPRWYAKDPAFDALVSDRFAPVQADAQAGRLDQWLDTADGALALVILLDQFPRNMYRDKAGAFASDARARMVANEAIRRGHDQGLPAPRRHFFYMPFEHSENLDDQARAVALMAAMGDGEDLVEWARKHYTVIERFGRFPHRNTILGRPSTPEEIAFLAEPGSSF